MGLLSRSTTLKAVLLFSIPSFFASGCARPVEERTAAEKKANAEHRAKLNLAKMEKNDPYWIQAREEIARLETQPSVRPAAEVPGRGQLAKIVRGPHNEKSLLLTFDDGPHVSSTLKLLKVLKDENVKATFFVIGKVAEKHRDLVRAIQAGGHTIGNHTFSHVTLTKFPLEEVRTEYRANNEIIKEITGEPMTFCRPPGGDYDPTVLKAAQAEGLTTVLWTDDPGDFANPGDGIVLDRTLKRLSNGGVILLHDGSPNTLDVLRELIHEARARGFTFTTPSAMAAGIESERRLPIAMRSVGRDERD